MARVLIKNWSVMIFCNSFFNDRRGIFGAELLIKKYFKPNALNIQKDNCFLK